jgi:hypothetical protein
MSDDNRDTYRKGRRESKGFIALLAFHAVSFEGGRQTNYSPNYSSKFGDGSDT